MPKLKTTAEFIENVKQIYGDLYNCDKVKYVNSRTPVILVCSKHGEFSEQPVIITKTGGYACKGCGNERFVESVKKRTGTKETFINKALEIYGNKYNYDKVVYKNAKTNVIIICPEHGEFNRLPDDHLRYRGCSKCGKISCGNIQRKTKEEFIESSRLTHGDKFEYDNVNYVKNKTKVTITCKTHGDFEQSPANHLYFNGCPKCLNFTNENDCISIIETITGNKFSKTRPKFLKGLELDGYNEELNIAIEYNGEQHYKIVDHFHRNGIVDLLKQVENDKLKLERCKENGIDLIIVPYYVIDKTEFIQEQLDLIV